MLGNTKHEFQMTHSKFVNYWLIYETFYKNSTLNTFLKLIQFLEVVK